MRAFLPKCNQQEAVVIDISDCNLSPDIVVPNIYILAFLSKSVHPAISTSRSRSSSAGVGRHVSCEVVSLLEVLTAHLHIFQYFS